MTKKRILLFIAFTYGIYWSFAGLCDLAGILQSAEGFYFLTNCAMFTPALGSLLTRLLTREGMKDSLLEIDVKGKGKYYLLAALIPLFYSAVEVVLTVPAMKTGFHPQALFDELGVSAVGYTASIFFNIAVALVLLPVFLGEELGWRGYLFPKLKEIMPRPAAYAVSGILWGAWHTPAIIDGHNFGKDYMGYPYVGILLMCCFCTAAGVIFTWLTEKSGSVYPAAIAHAVNNNAASSIIALAGNNTDESMSPYFFLIGVAAVWIVALLCLGGERISRSRRSGERPCKN